MFTQTKNRFRSGIWFLLLAFAANTCYVPIASAQDFTLPVPGVRVSMSPAFTPSIIRGMTIDTKNPFAFSFLVDKGDENIAQADKKEQYERLIKYFLSAMTIPEGHQWVNLSPYEKNRIIEEDFGKTEMGRDLLGQDYFLKQITASLLYPEEQLGKEFWARVYKEAQEKFGTTQIPVNTFNKVWIMPESADMYEKDSTVLIVDSKLKVMLEEDYLSVEKNAAKVGGPGTVANSAVRPVLGQELGAVPNTSAQVRELGKKILREIVIPELTKEVNEGKNFATLRQIYHGMILAAWYKQNLKESILTKIYADKGKVEGLVIASEAKQSQQEQPLTVENIYQQYLKAFKKGVYNYVKEEADPLSGEMIPRKYFSGGYNPAMTGVLQKGSPAQISKFTQGIPRMDVAKAIIVSASLPNAAMTTPTEGIKRPDPTQDIHIRDIKRDINSKGVESEDILKDERVQRLLWEYLERDIFIVLTGGASKMSNEDKLRVIAIMDALGILVKDGIKVGFGDGGTDEGSMAAAGEVRRKLLAEGGDPDGLRLLGIAPDLKIAFTQEERDEAKRLGNPTKYFGAKNHDILAVPGDNFGKERGYMFSAWGVLGSSLEDKPKDNLFEAKIGVTYSVFKHIADKVPSVALLINGGLLTLKEVQENINQRRRSIVLKGSGRAADVVAMILEGKSNEEIMASATLSVDQQVAEKAVKAEKRQEAIDEYKGLIDFARGMKFDSPEMKELFVIVDIKKDGENTPEFLAEQIKANVGIIKNNMRINGYNFLPANLNLNGLPNPSLRNETAFRQWVDQVGSHMAGLSTGTGVMTGIAAFHQDGSYELTASDSQKQYPIVSFDAQGNAIAATVGESLQAVEIGTFHDMPQQKNDQGVWVLRNGVGRHLYEEGSIPAKPAATLTVAISVKVAGTQTREFRTLGVMLGSSKESSNQYALGPVDPLDERFGQADANTNFDFVPAERFTQLREVSGKLLLLSEKVREIIRANAGEAFETQIVNGRIIINEGQQTIGEVAVDEATAKPVVTSYYPSSISKMISLLNEKINAALEASPAMTGALSGSIALNPSSSVQFAQVQRGPMQEMASSVAQQFVAQFGNDFSIIIPGVRDGHSARKQLSARQAFETRISNFLEKMGLGNDLLDEDVSPFIDMAEDLGRKPENPDEYFFKLTYKTVDLNQVRRVPSIMDALLQARQAESTNEFRFKGFAVAIPTPITMVAWNNYTVIQPTAPKNVTNRERALLIQAIADLGIDIDEEPHQLDIVKDSFNNPIGVSFRFGYRFNTHGNILQLSSKLASRSGDAAYVQQVVARMTALEKASAAMTAEAVVNNLQAMDWNTPHISKVLQAAADILNGREINSIAFELSREEAYWMIRGLFNKIFNPFDYPSSGSDWSKDVKNLLAIKNSSEQKGKVLAAIQAKETEIYKNKDNANTRKANEILGLLPNLSEYPVSDRLIELGDTQTIIENTSLLNELWEHLRYINRPKEGKRSERVDTLAQGNRDAVFKAITQLEAKLAQLDLERLQGALEALDNPLKVVDDGFKITVTESVAGKMRDFVFKDAESVNSIRSFVGIVPIQETPEEHEISKRLRASPVPGVRGDAGFNGKWSLEDSSKRLTLTSESSGINNISGTDTYTITFQETPTSVPITVLAKRSFSGNERTAPVFAVRLFSQVSKLLQAENTSEASRLMVEISSFASRSGFFGGSGGVLWRLDHGDWMEDIPDITKINQGDRILLEEAIKELGYVYGAPSILRKTTLLADAFEKLSDKGLDRQITMAFKKMLIKSGALTIAPEVEFNSFRELMGYLRPSVINPQQFTMTLGLFEYQMNNALQDKSAAMTIESRAREVLSQLPNVQQRINKYYQDSPNSFFINLAIEGNKVVGEIRVPVEVGKEGFVRKGELDLLDEKILVIFERLRSVVDEFSAQTLFQMRSALREIAQMLPEQVSVQPALPKPKRSPDDILYNSYLDRALDSASKDVIINKGRYGFNMPASDFMQALELAVKKIREANIETTEQYDKYLRSIPNDMYRPSVELALRLFFNDAGNRTGNPDISLPLIREYYELTGELTPVSSAMTAAEVLNAFRQEDYFGILDLPMFQRDSIYPGDYKNLEKAVTTIHALSSEEGALTVDGINLTLTWALEAFKLKMRALSLSPKLAFEVIIGVALEQLKEKERIKGSINDRNLPSLFRTWVTLKLGDRQTAEAAIDLARSDAAMRGGIDLDSANFNLRIKRDGAGVPLPINLQDQSMLNAPGFIPIILEIKPAMSLPIFSELKNSAAKS